MNLEPLIFDPMLNLLKKSRKGDKRSAEALVRQVSPKLYGVAYRLLNDASDAEEIVQEALIKLWKISDDWKSGNAKIETWLYRVVTNLAIDKLRHRSKFVKGELDDNIISNEENPEETIEGSELARDMDNLIENLPPRQKAVIIFTYFEGKGAKEVAKIMDTSVEAVESLLARAKKNLKKIMLESNFNSEYYGIVPANV